MRQIKILTLMMLFIGIGYADNLKIGIKPSEPWVMYDKNSSIEDKKPQGFSIDLWSEISKKIGLKHPT